MGRNGLILIFALATSVFAGTQIEIVVEPKIALTNKWQFVIDASHSMHGVFDKAIDGFLAATAYPTDELEFSTIVFSDNGMQEQRAWAFFSPDEKTATLRWINQKLRTMSYVNGALEMAIRQTVPNLTVIIISDGGFTEVTMGGGKSWDRVENVINASQQWRRNNNLEDAIICCIGVENTNYRSGNKPSNEECQEFLKKIGSDNNGGYFYVSEVQ